ncbi:hypothetical protein SAQ01S_27790 [Sphingomonas aquatilis NBRC 16722]|nr:hypothetical protein SAQ01S_27790 [Sphingomonas aquatilis NBRC 16722]
MSRDREACWVIGNGAELRPVDADQGPLNRNSSRHSDAPCRSGPVRARRPHAVGQPTGATRASGYGRGYGAVIGMVVIAGRSDDEIEIPASCDLAAQRAITAPRDRGQLAIGQIEERDVASNDAETT